MMAMRRSVGTVVLVVSVVLTGLAAAAGADGEYKIGPEDVLDITVWDNATLSRAVPVRPDGKISLPLLNDVPVAGLSPMQLRELLTKKLAEYMPSPEVSVIVREIRSLSFSVVGEIRNPGRYELRSGTTVLDALARGGPFNDFAARSRIFVLRSNGADMKRIPFNYSKAIGANAERQNFVLEPGDIVVVP